MTLDDFKTLVFAYGTACIERDDGLSDSGEPLAALVSAFEAAKAEVPEATLGEIAGLKTEARSLKGTLRGIYERYDEIKEGASSNAIDQAASAMYEDAAEALGELTHEAYLRAVRSEPRETAPAAVAEEARATTGRSTGRGQFMRLVRDLENGARSGDDEAVETAAATIREEFLRAKAEVPEAAQEEIAQLRAALEENYVVDMVSPQYEADHTIEISDGWACAYCDLGDGNANRPYADEKAGVTHVAGCPLYRADLEPARLAALKAAGEEACREIGIDPGAATGRQVDSGACEP